MANVNWGASVVLMFNASGTFVSATQSNTTQGGVDLQTQLKAANPTFTVVLIDFTQGAIVK